MGINRGTVLDLINDVHRASGFKDYNSYSYLFDQVDTMPESVEKPEPHWIPVTERLPEYGEEVLTITQDDVYEVNHVIDDVHGEWFWEDNGDVIAWMPLPEPYRGVTE